MKKIKLLFVEDDASFAFVTKGSLELTGLYDIRLASNGKEGLLAYQDFCPDVIVSDIELPVLDGMEMVRKIRQKDEEIPILFATGRTSARDVLDGYQLKVDNFIKKPFLPDELNEHIQAIMRRIFKSKSEKSKGTVYIGNYIFIIETRFLHWKEGGLKLTKRESLILQRLYEKRNSLVKRDELLDELWETNDFFSSRSLDVFITKLRKYLANDPSLQIKTIRQEGLILQICN
jgi:Response regulators consisting of a CheY-like receiver domain and a winged-helix DNA-binding domain